MYALPFDEEYRSIIAVDYEPFKRTVYYFRPNTHVYYRIARRSQPGGPSRKNVQKDEKLP